MNIGNILEVNIENELSRSYTDYAMSVIVGRTDIRDGLKPVHRRVLYAMSELKMIGTNSTKNRQISW